MFNSSTIELSNLDIKFFEAINMLYSAYNSYYKDFLKGVFKLELSTSTDYIDRVLNNILRFEEEVKKLSTIDNRAKNTVLQFIRISEDYLNDAKIDIKNISSVHEKGMNDVAITVHNVTGTKIAEETKKVEILNEKPEDEKSEEDLENILRNKIKVCIEKEFPQYFSYIDIKNIINILSEEDFEYIKNNLHEDTIEEKIAFIFEKVISDKDTLKDLSEKCGYKYEEVFCGDSCYAIMLSKGDSYIFPEYIKYSLIDDILINPTEEELNGCKIFIKNIYYKRDVFDKLLLEKIAEQNK